MKESNLLDDKQEKTTGKGMAVATKRQAGKKRFRIGGKLVDANDNAPHFEPKPVNNPETNPAVNMDHKWQARANKLLKG